MKSYFRKKCMADCALVCTQDQMHYEPVTMALQRGYHVLCEKPMSPKKEEIIQMGMLAEKYNRVLAICHVLRYSSFYTKLKELLDSGKIGKLMSIQAMESVGFWHHAHSFVRGNWRNAKESSPMILQKCCHDMDILLWLAKAPCKKISLLGNLLFLKKKMRLHMHQSSAWMDALIEITVLFMHRSFIWNIQRQRQTDSSMR